jgi:hypothetical protein
MTRTDEFIGQLESYLDEYEGNTPLPEDVRDAIRAELPSTRQRPAWWPVRRSIEMSTFAKFGLAAAAVVVVALLGIRFLIPGAGVGGPDPTPTPEPEPRALVDGSEGPGFFVTEFFSETPVTDPVQFTFEMPADWGAVRPWVIGPSSEGAGPAMAFVQVSGLYSEPCLANAGTPDIAVGSTAAELASALAEHEAYEATATGDITVDGHDGIRMELVMPSDLDYSTCQSGQFWVWPEPFFAEEPTRWDVRIVDLGGKTVVVLVDGTATPQEQDQIEEMVASMQIQP